MSLHVGIRTAVALGLCVSIAPSRGPLAALDEREERAQAVSPPSSSAVEEAYRANNLGVAYLEQYNYEGAAKAFRQALAIDDRNRLARINLAIALLYVPDIAGAGTEARAAIQVAPDAPQPHYVLGLVARAENRTEDGIAAFERVLAVDPADIGARVNLGQLYLQQRKYAEAAELFKAAYDSEPYNVTAAYNLGVALTRAGQVEEGQRIMARFQALRESGYGTTFSNVYLEQGRYAEALVSTGAEADLVDRAVPAVRFAALPLLEGAPGEGGASPPGGSRSRGSNAASRTQVIALADHDRDGDLDLFAAVEGGVSIVPNEGGRYDKAGRALLTTPFPVSVILVADADNDLAPDVLLAGPGGIRLFRQGPDAGFTDVTATTGLPASAAFGDAAAFVDVDHDGDADVVAAASPGAPGAAPGPASARLFRNNGNGTFAEASKEAGLTEPIVAAAIVPTDYDNRRDVDLLLSGPGRAPALLKNQRDGSFRDVGAEVGLGDVDRAIAIAAGDVNKDEFPDFVFTRDEGPPLLAMSDGRGRFALLPAPPSASRARGALLLDYDNDGLLDLLTASADGVRLFRGLGGSWADLTERAIPESWRGGSLAPAGDSPIALGAGDLDGDGDTDLVVRFASGRVEQGANDGGSRHLSLRIDLVGRVSNRSGAGAKVEVRAGSLRSRTEVYIASPAPAPADLLFGLGTRPAADVVRILWPSGVLQAEILESTPGRQVRELDVTELDRKPSSCPYLYTWNGERFEFVTDFMGGGEMGYLVAPGVRNVPDPDEYVLIAGDRLRPHNGRFELRVTNELEEALFIDRLQLLVVDHPQGSEVYPHEGLTTPARSGLTLFVAHDPRPARRVIDARGRDVTARAARLDREFIDDLPLLSVRGHAETHALTIDTGAPPDGRRVLLLLTGWTDYAFSSDNVAAHQAGHLLKPPALQVKDAWGQWQTVIEQVGVPVGRPQTIVADLTDRFLSASREVRIVTSMRIYWDRILVDASGRAEVIDARELGQDGHRGSVRVARLDPAGATLRGRGFSAEISPDGKAPFGYDYSRVSPLSPWKQMPGRYTREGDVGTLLLETDDMFVVSAPGDEIALSFEAHAVAEPPPGVARTFLLFSHGYSKEMDLSSASPDRAWPLPFRGMSRYPYAWPETYPSTAAHRDYLERYNTRVIGRMVTPLDVLLAQVR